MKPWNKSQPIKSRWSENHVKKIQIVIGVNEGMISFKTIKIIQILSNLIDVECESLRFTQSFNDDVLKKI